MLIAWSFVRVISACDFHMSAGAFLQPRILEYTHLAPTGSSTRIFVLDEQVGSSDLSTISRASIGTAGIGPDLWSRVVLCHVGLELLSVGSRGWFPSRQFLAFVEVVGEVLGVGVSNFPSSGETVICLCAES